MHDDNELQQILTLAGQVYGPIAAGTSTYAHVDEGRKVAVDNSIRDSVDVAIRIRAYARAVLAQADANAAVTARLAPVPVVFPSQAVSTNGS